MAYGVEIPTTTRRSARLGLPCEVGHASLEGIRSASGDGFEAAARKARYRFLTATAQTHGARYVAVAHTAEDQAETILHRILRGTGIRGLAGMGRVRPLSPATTLIRPLLGFRRADLRAYLEDLGQPYRLDASNLDLGRTRNRIRHRLLPELAARFNPNVVDALVRLGTLAGEARCVVDSVVEQLTERAVREATPREVHIDLCRLQGESRHVLREMFMAIWRVQGWPLRDMGLRQWDLLAETAQQAMGQQPLPPRRMAFPGGVLVETGPGLLSLHRLA
jgi:tRNA(Ile)-lysidine synthase